MLRLRDISKTFIVDEEDIRFFEALKSINITLTKKEFVVILGKSGSGKSTLLNIISGIDSFDNGTYYYFENRVNKFEETHFDYFRSTKCGMVFQNYYLIDHLTILENIMVAQRFGGINKKNKDDAKRALYEVGLSGFEHKYPYQLSSGERQRVAIARSIVNKPMMIIADEPTGNLDSNTSKEILELFKRLSKERLVLMVTHDEDAAVVYADRVIQIDEGKVILDYKVVETQQSLEDTEVIFRKRVNPIASISFGIRQLYIYKWKLLLSILLFSISLTFIAGAIFYQKGYSSSVAELINEEQSLRTIYVKTSSSLINGLDFEDSKLVLKNQIGSNTTVLRNHQLDLWILKLNNQQMQTRIIINGISPYIQESDLSNLDLYEDGRFPINQDEIILSYQDATALIRTKDLNIAWSQLKNMEIEVPYLVHKQAIYTNLVTELNTPSPECSLYEWNKVDEPINFTSYGVGDFITYQAYLDSVFGSRGLLYQGDQYFVCSEGYLQSNSIPLTTKQLANQNILSTKTLTIVGIVESKYHNTSYINYDTLIDMEGKNHTVDTHKLQLYYLTDQLPTIQGLDYVEVKLTTNALNELINDRSMRLQLTVLYLLSGLFGVTIILAFSSQVQLQSQKERKTISILRSVGASKQDIKTIYVAQGLIIGFVVSLILHTLSITVVILGNLYVNTIGKNETIELFGPTGVKLFQWNYITVLILSAIGLIATTMVYHMIYRTYSKEKIIQLIRNR
ncbi:MAG TPA: ATP-binding cassette domain-containing protein [Bacilli bacterium]|nr:ATP-binding cassette domain-containing protein [Bacilli bacterium]